MPSSVLVEQHHECSLAKAKSKMLKLELELLREKNKAAELAQRKATREMKLMEYQDKRADNKEKTKAWIQTENAQEALCAGMAIKFLGKEAVVNLHAVLEF
jgi:hypothetical protein